MIRIRLKFVRRNGNIVIELEDIVHISLSEYLCGITGDQLVMGTCSLKKTEENDEAAPKE